MVSEIVGKLVRVVFGIPNEGNTEPEAYDDRMMLSFRLGMLQILSQQGLHKWRGAEFVYPKGECFEFSIISIGKVFTALARERIAEAAVEFGADWLFMVDDDMVGTQPCFELLYRHKVDICAALAFSRYPPHKPVIYRLNSGYDHFQHKPYYINYPVYDYPKDQLVECDAVGFGAVLIRTEILKALPKPWFMVTSGAGEDIHFCHSAVKAGFKCYMDTSVKLGHLGLPQVVTEETFFSESNQKALHGEYAKPRACGLYHPDDG